jgi:uncharacterized protein YqjF (DUF2071 family)
MQIQDILSRTDHRPWDMPKEAWIYYQEWNKAIFLHYQVDIVDLERWVPDGLEIDTYEGRPWVSIVAFTMEKIRPKYLPSIAMISNFDEVNIRTYVRSGGKRGVYFLSIEGGKWLSCKIAKGLSQLPYRYSTIKRSENRYKCTNASFKDNLDISYKVGHLKGEKSGLDRWLTERYVLFQDSYKQINSYEIHHVEWPIYDLDIEGLKVDYKRFSPMLLETPTKVQYSSGVQVLAWGRKITPQ